LCSRASRRTGSAGAAPFGSPARCLAGTSLRAANCCGWTSGRQWTSACTRSRGSPTSLRTGSSAPCSGSRAQRSASHGCGSPCRRSQRPIFHSRPRPHSACS
jgi:hypothetical protein